MNFWAKIIDLLFLATLVLAANGIGSFLLGLIKIKFESFGEETVFAQATGLVFLSMATFALGYAGMLQSWLFRALFIAAVIIFSRRNYRLAAYLLKSLLNKANLRINFNNILLSILIVFALLNVAASLAPVHASDAVSYHIAAPKIYAEHGRIVDIQYNIPSQYPPAIDMIFLDAYLLSSGELAEATAAYIGILFAAIIYFFCARHFTRRTGLLAATLFYTMPLFSVFNVRAFVDIGTGFYAFLAIYCIFMLRSQNETRVAALSGIFAGFAAATKTSAMLIPVAIWLILAWANWAAHKDMKKLTVNTLIYGAAAAAIIAPSMIRTYANTGNPVYPLLYSILGGEYLNRTLANYSVEILHKVGFGSGIKDFLLLPWNLTMHSSAFGEKVAIGPAFLAFLPALALIKNVERKIKLLLACALLFIIPWFLTAQIVRYIFIVYAILAIASAYAITRMLKEKALGIAAVAALTAIILINAGIWAGANSDELRAAAGIQDKEKFLMQSMTNYGLLEYANQNLENAKICLYGEMNGYYSDNDYVWCHPGYQGYVDFSTIGTGEKLLDRFREIQVTHLLVENSMNGWRKKYEQSGIVTGLMLLNNSDKAVGELLENNSELLYENENGAIYKIKYD